MASSLRDEIERRLREAIDLAGLDPPAAIQDEMRLLDTGLDSLGLAMLIVDLEERLGYDPFTLTAEPIYPQTFGQFVEMYERFADKRR